MSRPVRSADIAELRAFCAAVDLGSLGRAARLLRVTQPALSKRLRTLEALAGAQLLERSSRGVVPTPAGNRLYLEARKLLTQADAVDALMTGLSSEEAPVRLAASHTVAEFVLPGRLVELETRHERHFSVELFIANSTVVRELVREGRSEIGIAATEPSGSSGPVGQELPFCRDEVIVAVPRGHRWAARERIPLEELVETPLILRDPGANTRRTVESALAPLGLSLSAPLAEVGSTSAAKAAAVSECAPVLVSSLAVHPGDPDLVARRVEGLNLARRFVLLLGADDPPAPAARALAEHLLDREDREPDAVTAA